MKRLCVTLFIAVLPFDALAEDVKEQDVKRLDLQNCKIMLIFAEVWKYSPLDEKERAVWIVKNSNGEYESIKWLRTPQRNITNWSDSLPENIVAVAHTHGDHLDPKPSQQDISVAQHLDISVYTLTRKGIWRAAPDGSITEEVGQGWFEKTMTACKVIEIKEGTQQSRPPKIEKQY